MNATTSVIPGRFERPFSNTRFANASAVACSCVIVGSAFSNAISLGDEVGEHPGPGLGIEPARQPTHPVSECVPCDAWRSLTLALGIGLAVVGADLASLRPQRSAELLGRLGLGVVEQRRQRRLQAVLLRRTQASGHVAERR